MSFIDIVLPDIVSSLRLKKIYMKYHIRFIRGIRVFRLNYSNVKKYESICINEK